jgi:TonB family protein
MANGAVGVVEAVVSTTGTVESVKLIASSTVHHAMILSAVKTWEFRPATKDGQPVRFRHFIHIP